LPVKRDQRSWVAAEEVRPSWKSLEHAQGPLDAHPRAGRQAKELDQPLQVFERSRRDAGAT
jgi:hypothetical protein